MNKKTLKKLKKLRNNIKLSADIIAEERNKIRDLLDDFNNLHDIIFDGLQEIECGIDTLSQYL